MSIDFRKNYEIWVKTGQKVLTNTTEGDIIKYIFMRTRQTSKILTSFAIILIKSKSKL